MKLRIKKNLKSIKITYTPCVESDLLKKIIASLDWSMTEENISFCNTQIDSLLNVFTANKNITIGFIVAKNGAVNYVRYRKN